MEFNILAAGSLVYVTCHGPYWGLRGIVRAVDVIALADAQESMCFYLVALQDSQVKEPLWLVHDDIAAVEGENTSQWRPRKQEPSQIEIEALNIVLNESEYVQERSLETLSTV
jgi:hypothetical protein